MKRTLLLLGVVILFLVGGCVQHSNTLENTIPDSCHNFFDGCNECVRQDGSAVCTKKFCEIYEEPRCLDDQVSFSNCHEFGSEYSKDQNSAYYNLRELNVADAAGFVCVDNTRYYAKDAQKVFCFGEEIEGADVHSFTLTIGNNPYEIYANDKNNVYSLCETIENADVNTFEVLQDRYAKDKNNVYFEGVIVQDADPLTFEVFEESIYHNDYGADTENVYYRGEFHSVREDFELTREIDERCSWDPAPGLCKAFIPSYYYDHAEETCKKFIWGGCKGVRPFETLEECQAACEQ